jgi:hypothetical protein
MHDFYIKIIQIIHNYLIGTIGLSAFRDNVKVVYNKLSDGFHAQNNLQYKQGQVEMEAQQGIVMGPTVKPNFVAMAKAASKDKDSVHNNLNNLFQLIRDLLQGGYQR